MLYLSHLCFIVGIQQQNVRPAGQPQQSESRNVPPVNREQNVPPVNREQNSRMSSGDRPAEELWLKKIPFVDDENGVSAEMKEVIQQVGYRGVEGENDRN